MFVDAKILYIKEIFDIEASLGVIDRQIKRNKYYFNDRFDYLYDMTYDEIYTYQQGMKDLGVLYNKIKYERNRQQQKQ